MTPREMNGRIKAISRTIEETAQRDSDLAWSIGVYVGIAFNNPTKFPDKPTIKNIELDEEMPADDMKDRLSMFANTHNAIEEMR